MSRCVLIVVFALIVVSGCASEHGTGAGSQGAPSGTGTFKGIPVGFTRQGHPYLGKAGAPVTMEEFSDFLCPFCGRHAGQTLPILVRDFIATGKIKYVFHDMPLSSLPPTAAHGHVASTPFQLLFQAISGTADGLVHHHKASERP